MPKTKLKSIFKHKKFAPALLLLVSVLALSAVVGAATMSAVIIANTPEDIVPTNVSSISIQVKSPAGQVLSDWITAAAGEKANYIDPNGLYSPIEAVSSDSWLSDPTGAFLESDHVTPLYDALLTPRRDDAGRIVAFQMLYHYVVWMTVEAVLRTGPANPIRYVPSTTMLDPLVGEVWPCAWTAAESTGALVGWEYMDAATPIGPWFPRFQTNTMLNSRRTIDGEAGTQAPYAKITTSVVPYTSWAEMIVPTESAPLSATVISRLESIVPVLPVHVDAKVSVQGNMDRIKTYNNSFSYTLSDGTAATVTVDTVDARVGFGMVGGMQPTGTYMGLVPNVNPLHQIPEYDLDDPAFDNLHDPTPNEFVPGPAIAPDIGTGSVMIEGYVRIKNLAPQVLLSPSTSVEPIGTYPVTHIELENIEGNCGLPSTLDVGMSATMGARLTAAVATAELRTEIAHGTESETWIIDPGSWYIQWPYGLGVDNVMAAQNYTFPVDVVSERAVQLVSGDGRPIDLSTLVDTDKNSIFHDPRVDELYVFMNTPDLTSPCHFNILDIWGWLLCTVAANWASLWWIVALLVAIVIIALLWLVGKVSAFLKGVYRWVKGGFHTIKKLFGGK